MSDKSINLRDRHAWPVAGSILLIFLTAFDAMTGFIVSAVGIITSLIYYYRAKSNQRQEQDKHDD